MGTKDSKKVDMQWKKYGSLWDEYKYRHDLIWQRTFTFTTAIVLISIIPYIQQDVARLLDKWIIIPPVLAVALAFFGLLVMLNELYLFRKIKDGFRKQQNILIKECLHNLDRPRWFSIFVAFYFIILLVLSIANCYVVWKVYIPNVPPQPPVCPCPWYHHL